MKLIPTERQSLEWIIQVAREYLDRKYEDVCAHVYSDECTCDEEAREKVMLDTAVESIHRSMRRRVTDDRNSQ